MKKVIGILTVLFFCSSAFGCSPKPESGSAPGGSSGGVVTSGQPAADASLKLVKKEAKTKYILSNGIEVKNLEKTINTSKGTVHINLPQIDGLVDKKLEAKINESISNDIRDGINLCVAEMNEKPEYLYSMVSFNANNLLSISVCNLYSPPMLGLLYRLTDGQRLSLSDIFTAGTDYVPLVNQKVIEGIIAKEPGDEEMLREPFSTIRPDQDFVLGLQKLDIIFRTGEAGFARGVTISIPLSEIDDYVDVADRYSGTERKNHEKADLIVRNNNIFTTEKGEIINRSNGKVWTYYPVVSGWRDPALEAEINNEVSSSINEVLNSGVLDSIKENPDEYRDAIAAVEVSVDFNHYGILTLHRQITYFGKDNGLDDFSKLYSFDLLNRQKIETQDILRRYLEKDKDLEVRFTELVKSKLRSDYGRAISGAAKQVDSLDYASIMNSGRVYFSYSYFEGIKGIYINVAFDKNVLGGNPYRVDAMIPFRDLVKETPEEFFAG